MTVSSGSLLRAMRVPSRSENSRSHAVQRSRSMCLCMPVHDRCTMFPAPGRLKLSSEQAPRYQPRSKHLRVWTGKDEASVGESDPQRLKTTRAGPSGSVKAREHEDRELPAGLV